MLALFRVELDAVDLSPANDGGERPAVVGDGEDVLRPGLTVVGVVKVGPGAGRQAVEQGAWPARFDLIPAGVGDFEV